LAGRPPRCRVEPSSSEDEEEDEEEEGGSACECEAAAGWAMRRARRP
jgi:hypothetical protein